MLQDAPALDLKQSIGWLLRCLKLRVPFACPHALLGGTSCASLRQYARLRCLRTINTKGHLHFSFDHSCYRMQ